MTAPDWDAQSEHLDTESFQGSGCQHAVQTAKERDMHKANYREMFVNPTQIVMPSEEQNAAKRTAFVNNETMPKETELQS